MHRMKTQTRTLDMLDVDGYGTCTHSSVPRDSPTLCLLSAVACSNGISGAKPDTEQTATIQTDRLHVIDHYLLILISTWPTYGKVLKQQENYNFCTTVIYYHRYMYMTNRLPFSPYRRLPTYCCCSTAVVVRRTTASGSHICHIILLRHQYYCCRLCM